MSGLLRRPRYADVVGTLALVVATSGAAYAVHALPKNSVGPAQVRKGAIHSAEIKDGKVKAKDLAPGAVGGAQIADGSVSLADIVGVEVTVTLSWAVTGDSCQAVSFAVAGAEVGQGVLVTPTTNTSTAVLSPAYVSSPGTVTMHVCAVGLGSIVSMAPFHVVTLA